MKKKIGVSIVIATITALLIATTAFALYFSNGNFEMGDFSGWTQEYFLNNGLVGAQPYTGASIVRDAGGSTQSMIMGPFAPRSQTDPYSPLKYPAAGSYTARVNGDTTGYISNTIKQTATATTNDIDAADGLVHMRFIYAAVMEDPGHVASDQPWFYVNVTNSTTSVTLYDKFSYVGDANPWSTVGAAAGWTYLDWNLVDVSGAGLINVGDTIVFEAIAADCAQGGHAGYVYMDEIGSTLPAAGIAASGPATHTGSGSAVNYQFDYTSVAALNNVVASVTLPADVTYVSVDDTTHCAEAGGVVTCTFPSLTAGASGSFIVNTTVNTGVTSTITLDTYSIVGDGANSSSGPAVVTTYANTAPVANNDAYSVFMSETLTTTVGNGVLVNDTDAESDPLTAVLVSAPSHASTFTLNANGTFTYIPVNGYQGTDTFTYNANDGALDSSAPATVTITIRPHIVGLRSGYVYDGWVLETTETSNVGGTIYSTGTALVAGDNIQNKQYRSVMQFYTGAIPDTAVVTKAVLNLKKIDTVGAPTDLGDLVLDFRTGNFGTMVLESRDFQFLSATGQKNRLGKLTDIGGNKYRFTLTPADYQYINKLGNTQVRLRFSADDNNNNTVDYIRFFSGEQAVTFVNRPQFLVEYYVPHP